MTFVITVLTWLWEIGRIHRRILSPLLFAQTSSYLTHVITWSDGGPWAVMTDDIIIGMELHFPRHHDDPRTKRGGCFKVSFMHGDCGLRGIKNLSGPFAHFWVCVCVPNRECPRNLSACRDADGGCGPYHHKIWRDSLKLHRWWWWIWCPPYLGCMTRDCIHLLHFKPPKDSDIFSPY